MKKFHISPVNSLNLDSEQTQFSAEQGQENCICCNTAADWLEGHIRRLQIGCFLIRTMRLWVNRTKILNTLKNVKAAYQQQLLLSSVITLIYIAM